MKSVLNLSKKLAYRATHLNCDICSKSSGINNLESKFVELELDKETQEFIDNCSNNFYQLAKASLLRPVLKYFYTVTDANAILGTGKMFLLSKNHIKYLLENQTFENMLDIGAGDGNVTSQFKDIIKGKITCTEASPNMINVLKNKGFDTQEDISGDYELIGLLNVLDRCDKPISILKSIQKIKKKFVIISIVLPFRGFYTEGLNKLPQIEKVIGSYKEWEESVHRLSRLFLDLGFNIEKISRLPYLSEGNFKSNMYSLDTAIFILS